MVVELAPTIRQLIQVDLAKVLQPRMGKYVIQAAVVEVEEDMDDAFIAQVAVENLAEHSQSPV